MCTACIILAACANTATVGYTHIQVKQCGFKVQYLHTDCSIDVGSWLCGKASELQNTWQSIPWECRCPVFELRLGVWARDTHLAGAPPTPAGPCSFRWLITAKHDFKRLGELHSMYVIKTARMFAACWHSYAEAASRS